MSICEKQILFSKKFKKILFDINVEEIWKEIINKKAPLVVENEGEFV